MPEFQIQHITTYVYDSPVRDSANQILGGFVPDGIKLQPNRDLVPTVTLRGP